MFPSALKDREICNRFKTERKAFQKIGKGYVDIFGFGEEKKKKPGWVVEMGTRSFWRKEDGQLDFLKVEQPRLYWL